MNFNFQSDPFNVDSIKESIPDVGVIRRRLRHNEDDSLFSLDSMKGPIQEVLNGSQSKSFQSSAISDNQVFTALNLNSLSLRDSRDMRHPITQPYLNDISMEDIEDSQDIEDIEMLDADELREPMEDHIMSTPKSSKRSVVSSLLSPTRLGAQLAAPEGALVLYNTGEEDKEKSKSKKPNLISSGVQTEGIYDETNEQAEQIHQPSHQPTKEQLHDPANIPKSQIMDPSLSSNNDYLNMPTPTPHWISTHDNIPYVLSSYVQLLVNIFIYCLFLYLILDICRLFWKDTDKIMNLRRSHLTTDINRCTREYLENDCRPGIRAPQLEDVCTQLEKCMDQDPDDIPRLPINAQLLGEIFNAFLGAFSLRYLFFWVFTLIITSYVLNVIFGYMRGKAYFKPSEKRSLSSPPPSNALGYP